MKTHLNYRPDIDGLRAIAVLAVVLFHAFPLKFPSGFIGVDIFFVISGFLISSIIIKNLENDTFSFIEFYKRRIKRIFPALLLILIFNMIIGFLLLTSDEYNQLGKHIISGIGFFSNFTLWKESGYFDVDSSNKPLLHLWSLGVEEQFYILWPLLIFSLWKSKISIAFSIAILTILSFYLNIHYVHEFPEFTFYIPVTRFWEFLCGCMLAWLNFKWQYTIYNIQYKKYYANISSLLGVSLLIITFVLLNKDSTFPGYWALLPTFAAVLIIAGKDSIFNKKILSNKIMVWFGVISFSLYLWHWPLLSFGQIFYSKLPPTGYRIIVIFVSIGLAWLTYKYIENPIRYSTNKLTFLKIIASYILCLFIGIVIYTYNFSDSHVFRTLTVQRKGFKYAYGPSIAWFEGKDNWLFLGNGFEHTVEKLKMATKPSNKEINETHQLFLDIAKTAEKYNTKVILILGPDKPTIYPEYLPNKLIPSSERYVNIFLNNLKNIDNLTIYDPTHNLLMAKKSQGLLYWRTDTHWNAKGAYIAFQGLAKMTKTPLLDVNFKPGATYSGDIYKNIAKLKTFPLSLGDNWEPVWKHKPIWSIVSIQKGKETSFGQLSVSVNKAPLSDKYVWVIGDSFQRSLRQYLNGTFKEVRYVGHWNDQLKILPTELNQAKRKPDIIIIERVERSF